MSTATRPARVPRADHGDRHARRHVDRRPDRGPDRHSVRLPSTGLGHASGSSSTSTWRHDRVGIRPQHAPAGRRCCSRWAPGSSSPCRCRRGDGGRSPSSASPCSSRPRAATGTPGRDSGGAWRSASAGWRWAWAGCGSSPFPATSPPALIFACLHGLAELAAPNGRWRVIGRPAAHSLVEALRFSFPFGGVPLASLGIAQVAGPLAGIARVGGVILITWVVFQLGFALGALAEAARLAAPGLAGRRRGGGRGRRRGGRRLLAPRGTGTGRSLDVAAVQGGGAQGTRALDVPTDGRDRTPPRGDPHDRTRPGPRRRAVAGERRRHERLRVERGAGGDRRRGGPARRAVRRRRHRGRPRRKPAGSPTPRSSSRPTATSRAATTRCGGCRSASTSRCAGLLEAIGAPVDQVPTDAVAGTEPGGHRAARRHAARRGHLVGGVLRRAGPRGRQGRRRGAAQPDQRRQLHRHDRADPAGGLEPAAGDRDGPLGRASRADRVLGVRVADRRRVRPHAVSASRR